ncbi:unnamed protein product, partial [Prorocentrum cordatum]
MLRARNEAADDLLVTQWSNILSSHVPHRVEEPREVASLAEKGDPKVWERLRGQLCLGMAPPENIVDLWLSPMSNDKGATLVKSVCFAPHPFELILLGRHCPRHLRVGLAVFKLPFIGSWSTPKILERSPSLVQIAAVTVTTVDVLAKDLPTVYAIIQTRLPRITFDLIFPTPPPVAHFLPLLHLRRAILPETTFFGSSLMCGGPDAMLLEINDPTVLHHSWPLCSQMVVLSDTRALVYSKASSEVWVEALDRWMLLDPGTAATELKWKPSRYGGRAVAAPSMIPSALAAAKTKTSPRRGAQDYVADIMLQGE